MACDILRWWCRQLTTPPPLPPPGLRGIAGGAAKVAESLRVQQRCKPPASPDGRGAAVENRCYFGAGRDVCVGVERVCVVWGRGVAERVVWCGGVVWCGVTAGQAL